MRKEFVALRNHRKHEDNTPVSDGERFGQAMRQIVGRRLT
jgi:hypothetical protein